MAKQQNQDKSGENKYFEVHPVFAEKKMQVREIEVRRIDRYDTRLVFWVLVHGLMDKHYAPFEFIWSGLTVSFLPEGAGKNEKVLFEIAFRQKTAIEKARVYLQNWLRHQGTIADLTELDLAPRSWENRYFPVHSFMENQKMHVRKITAEQEGKETYLTFEVYTNEGAYSRKGYRSYRCRWDGQTVFYMMGGLPKDSHAIEPASTLEEATEKARVFLQNWLRHCWVLETPPEAWAEGENGAGGASGADLAGRNGG